MWPWADWVLGVWVPSAWEAEMAKRRSDSAMLAVTQTERYIGVNLTGGGGSCGHGWWGGGSDNNSPRDGTC